MKSRFIFGLFSIVGPLRKELIRFQANAEATIGDLIKAEESLNKISGPEVRFEVTKVAEVDNG
jgi:hypothetical protein